MIKKYKCISFIVHYKGLTLSSLNFQKLALNKEFIITIQNCKVHDANFLEQKPTRDCDNLILRYACTGPDITWHQRPGATPRDYFPGLSIIFCVESAFVSQRFAWCADVSNCTQVVVNILKNAEHIAALAFGSPAIYYFLFFKIWTITNTHLVVYYTCSRSKIAKDLNAVVRENKRVKLHRRRRPIIVRDCWLFPNKLWC